MAWLISNRVGTHDRLALRIKINKCVELPEPLITVQPNQNRISDSLCQGVEEGAVDLSSHRAAYVPRAAAAIAPGDRCPRTLIAVCAPRSARGTPSRWHLAIFASPRRTIAPGEGCSSGRFREADRYMRRPIALDVAPRTSPPSTRLSALARARHAHAPKAVGKSEKRDADKLWKLDSPKGSDLRSIRRGRWDEAPTTRTGTDTSTAGAESGANGRDRWWRADRARTIAAPEVERVGIT